MSIYLSFLSNLSTRPSVVRKTGVFDPIPGVGGAGEWPVLRRDRISYQLAPSGARRDFRVRRAEKTVIIYAPQERPRRAQGTAARPAAGVGAGRLQDRPAPSTIAFAFFAASREMTAFHNRRSTKEGEKTSTEGRTNEQHLRLMPRGGRHACGHLILAKNRVLPEKLRVHPCRKRTEPLDM